LVLDFEDVPLIDSTAAYSLVAFVNKIKRSGTAVIFAGARRPCGVSSAAPD
jgi:anti-anti-sigma regulatory factor